MLNKLRNDLRCRIIVRAAIAVALTFFLIFSWEMYLESIIGDLSLIKISHDFEAIIETTLTAFLVILLYSWCGYRSDMIRQQWRNSSIEKSMYLESIIKNVADAVIIINEDGKILNFNDSAIEMFGYTYDEVICKNISVIIPTCQMGNHKYSIEKHTAGVSQVLDKKGREVIAQRKNGEKFPLSLSVSKLELKEDIVFIGTMSDITERKRTEQDLIENYRSLEEAHIVIEEQNHELMKLAGEHEEAKNIALAASKTKSEFLANMSHELRTPLNAIIGFSQMMMNGIGGDLSDKHKEYSNDILSSGSHLLKLINEILDLSKVEAGKIEIHPKNICICSVFRDCIGLISERAQEKAINIEVLTSCDGLSVYADSIRLKQIILNLLSNSVKFTDENGKIDISCIVGDNVIITIEDNGMGMDEEGVKAAITKFGQANTGLSRTHEGTGLGLPLSIELAKLMNGHIDIVSELGTGTTIIVTMPKAK